MRAALVDRYGDPEVVRVTEVPTPRLRGGQALVRVRAVAVTSGDARIRAGRFPKGFGFVARLALGLRGPRRPILGGSFAGTVEALADGTTGLEVGAEVCGMTGMKMGAHAELVAVPVAKLARVPQGVSLVDAAGVLFGGTTALHFLRDKGAVAPGASVLVNGASGAVGTSAVQLARHLGATVTAVTSGRNAALVTELGAERVIDHTKHDVADTAERFDLVFDTVGNLTIASGRRLLRPGGRLLLAVASLGETIRARGDVAAGPFPERVADFELLLQLVADGTLRVVHDPQTDAATLDDIVAAHRHVDGGHKIGNLVLQA